MVVGSRLKAEVLLYFDSHSLTFRSAVYLSVSLLYAFVLSLISGCSVYSSPVLANEERYDQVRKAAGNSIVSKWWKEFLDPGLNELVDEGFRNNFEFKSAKANLELFQSRLRSTSANLYPSLNFEIMRDVRYREKKSEGEWSIDLDFSYDFDFWNMISSQHAEARWRVYASNSSSQVVANKISKTIILNWFEILALKEKQLILRAQHERLDKAVISISRRYAYGQTKHSDVLAQRRLFESVKQSITDIEKKKNDLLQTLSTIVGRDLSKTFDTDSYSVNLPYLDVSHQKIENISEKIYGRPNVQKAFFEIEAENSALAAAIANQFPDFSLSLLIGNTANASVVLLEEWLAKLLIEVNYTIFDGGKKKELQRQKKIQMELALENFRNEWLRSSLTVNTLFKNETLLYSSLKSTEEQLRLAQEAEFVQRIRYINGSVNYFQFNRSQEVSLDLEVRVIDARLELLKNQVHLLGELHLSDSEHSG